MARRPVSARDAADAVFSPKSSVTAERMREAPSTPGGKESVFLRIDSDVLEWFQEDGPGWQDRINAALRAAAGK